MFTPIETTVGAFLLHEAATGFLFKDGYVLGASGLLRELLLMRSTRSILFMSGMASSYGLLKLVLPELLPAYSMVEAGNWKSVLFAIGMGALTGLGTKLGAGCTSGHMLCGLSRLSPRSLLATATFFPAAALTFNLVHGSSTPLTVCADVAGKPCYTPTYPSNAVTIRLLLLATAIIAQYHLTPPVVEKVTGEKKAARAWSTYLTGLTFGLGLLISGMATPSKVLAFFAVASPGLRNWDPSLALIIVFGILPQMAYYLSHQRQLQEKPAYAEKFSLPTTTLKDTDWRFVAGAAMFGIAWGLSGVCPGPAILRAVAQPLWGLMWMGGFGAGSLLV
ncbi:YeeE/YedE family integral membrane protein [Rhizodiscina lignyota]|uniref:YeeE/YedE family integral membrane protein n=1 Tax=Rhizodiscina lignyota TaxID=1504668 RepID=A0A9P4IEN6_9PEZI|nr:YeeE/YedE family integral membrane protein [Rhizodiscina lignyota]